MSQNFSKYRTQFPSLSQFVLLTSCSQSAIATTVNAAIQEYTDSLINEGMNWVKWMQKVNQAKSRFAQLIGAQPEDIAIMASVSDIISSIVTSLSFKGVKSRITTTELDFPTIPQVLLAQERLGAKIDFIPSVEHNIPLEYYEQYITEDTLLTCVSHVSYYNGSIQDIKAIADIAHRKGSYLFVDAYQSAGSVPIDVNEMNIDMLATGAQKFLLGVPGIAFMYMRPEIAEQLSPKVTGWFGQMNPFAFDNHNLIYAPGARRFETGTPPVINAYAAAAALDILLEIGVNNIHSYLKDLSKFALEYGQDKGIPIVSPQNLDIKSSTTAFYVGDASRIEQLMKQDGFVVSARKDVIRIAPHFYNTIEDIQAAIDRMSILLK